MMKVTNKILLVLAAVILLAPSCKKKNTDETKSYLNGFLTTGMTSCMLDKENPELVLWPRGIYHPGGKHLGCYTYISGVTGSNDTLFFTNKEPYFVSGESKVVRSGKGNVKHGFPDSLATYTVYVMVYPEDSDKYYSSSASISVTLLDRQTSIPEIAFVDDHVHTFTDTRDGRRYNFFEAGGLQWMKQNLSIAKVDVSGSPAAIGKAYCDSEIAGEIMGRFYNFEEASRACPDGWRLPSDAEWKNLAEALTGRTYEDEHADFAAAAGEMMVDAHLNGKKMWAFWPDVRIPALSKTTLRAIPLGLYNYSTPYKFDTSYEFAAFWTADSYAKDNKQAYYRYIFWQENDVKCGLADKTSMGLNVRCVRNK